MPSASGRSKPAVDRTLGEAHGDDRTGAERARPLERGVERGAGGHDAVDEAELERFGRLDVTPTPHQVLGARRADEPGGALGATAAREDAELDLGETEARRIARHPQVACERELESAAQGEALDGRDHRPRDRAQRVERAVDGRGDGGATPGSVNSSTSAPAANARSSPVTTTAFTDASAASADACAWSSSSRARGQRVQRGAVQA